MELERLMMHMNLPFVRPLLAAVVLVVASFVGRAQDLSRLKVEPFAEELEVSYTLKADRPLEVQLYYSEDDGYSWVGPLKSVTGDVGNSVSEGKNKIIWNFAEEVGELVGDRFRFKVKSSQHYGFSMKFRDDAFNMPSAVCADLGEDPDQAAFKLRQVSGWNSMELKAPSGNYSFEMHHVLKGKQVRSSVDLKDSHHRPAGVGMVMSAVLPGSGIPYVTFGESKNWTLDEVGRKAKKGNGNFWGMALFAGAAVLCHNLEIEAYNDELSRFNGTEASALEASQPYQYAKYGAGGLAGLIYTTQIIKVIKWNKAHKADMAKFVASLN